MSDQPQQILDQLKKNEVYLQQIATTQAQALEISKKSLATERYRVSLMAFKFLFIVILTWISFVFLKDMTQDLMGSMGGIMGGDGKVELGGASDLTNQLKSSQDLIREIMGN
jgi:hypothetical protein